jgi:ribosome biogenesis GTPase A
MSPVSLVVSRISKHVLEVNYKIKLPDRNHKKYTTTTFLSLFALQKGWITGGSSNPDMAVAAKRVLVDYTTGVIVFCHVRPDFDLSKHKAVKQSGFNLPVLETIPE